MTMSRREGELLTRVVLALIVSKSFGFISRHKRCLFHPFEYRNKLIYL